MADLVFLHLFIMPDQTDQLARTGLPAAPPSSPDVQEETPPAGFSLIASREREGVVDPGKIGDRFVGGQEPPRAPAADGSGPRGIFRGEIAAHPAIGQIERIARQLENLPASINAVDDRFIWTRMDLIHEAVTLLAHWVTDLQSDLRGIANRPEVRDLFVSIFANLAAILRKTSQWSGINIFAHRLIARCRHFFSPLPTELRQAIGAVVALHEDTIDYIPLDREAAPLDDELDILFPDSHTLDVSSRSFVTIRPEKLSNDYYRKALAQELFELSRGYPAMARQIVRDLANLLENPETQRDAILLIREFIPLSEKFPSDDALLVRDYAGIVGSEEPFYLLTTPTIFPPEHWTQTMLDGLKREDLSGKTGFEVGTGTGILPIYLAKNQGVKITSYDRNPDARDVATINAWLQSTNAEGNKLPGPQPIDLLEFAPRDLRDGPPEGLKADFGFGCLPQVPTSDRLTPRNSADRYEPEGFPEDKDGFGLLADFLEKWQTGLKENGRLILIISGRPGLTAVQKMANRRGYVPSSLLETVFEQDRWTELDGFVAVEQSGSRPPFEFIFGDVVITAATAQRILGEFREQYAAAETDEEREALLAESAYYRVLHRQFVVAFRPVKSFHAEWRARAIDAQRSNLQESGHIGYTEDTGSEYEPFRQEMAAHLSSLFEARIPEEALFVGPSAETLLHNLSLVRPHTVYELDDSSIDLQQVLEESTSFVVLAVDPTHSERLFDLTQMLKAKPELRQKVAILWQNSDLPVDEPPLATLVLWNNVVYEHMAMVGEDTYSRIPTLQAVYEASLLKSRRKAGFNIQTDNMPTLDIIHIEDLNQRRAEVTDRAWGLGRFLAHPPSLKNPGMTPEIDLSFGESEFPLDEPFRLRLIESLGGKAGATEVKRLVGAYLYETGRGLFHPNEIVLGAGVHPLIERTLSIIGDDGPFRVMVPEGSYGQFFPTIHTTGGEAEIFSVNPSTKDTAALKTALEKAFLSHGKKPPVKAFLLPYPTNPGGLYFSREALETILAFCKRHDIYLLADEIFMGTGRPGDQTSLFALAEQRKYRQFIRERLIGYSGLSKEYALGGVRFGFAYTRNRRLQTALASQQLPGVDRTALAIAQTVYAPSFRRPYGEVHLRWLEEKRAKMMAFLKPYAARIFFRKPLGGFFVEVDVRRLFGRTIVVDRRQWTISENGENFRDVLYQTTGIKVSPVGWSGNPSTVRFVYSIENLDTALERLKIFFDACAAKRIAQTDLKPTTERSLTERPVTNQAPSPVEETESPAGKTESPESESLKPEEDNDVSFLGGHAALPLPGAATVGVPVPLVRALVAKA